MQAKFFNHMRGFSKHIAPVDYNEIKFETELITF